MKKHDIYIDWELSGSNPYKPLLTRVITAALEEAMEQKIKISGKNPIDG